MRKAIPAVSIIIPMYNVEKYIGECLNSILAQTFQDYEVIVVDDCSTDNSVSIVESYLPKFNQDVTGGGSKLQLIRSEKNSNTPGMPRNVGIRFSRGEYILFVDSDDAITPTALEELYPIAKKFDAEVLYCEKFYPISVNEKFTTNKNSLKALAPGNIKYDFVSEPTPVSNDITKRLEDLMARRFEVIPWNYLIHRDLILMHDLHFPNIKYGEDDFWVLYILCYAKRLMRIPNVMYIHRRGIPTSISSNRSLEIDIHRYTDHLFQGVSIIKEFAEKFSFLKEHPEYQYALFDFLAFSHFSFISPLYKKIPAWQLEPLINRELDKVADKTPLTAFLLSRMVLLKLQLKQQDEIIQQMNDYIQQQNQALKQQQAKIEELQRRVGKVAIHWKTANKSY